MKRARLPQLLGAACALALAGFAVAVGVAWTNDVDQSEHDRYMRALRQARELDARLGQEVAKSRLGIVTHYDNLVRVWDETAVTHAELALIPTHVERDGAEVISGALDEYQTALTHKERAVETFKTEQAVLRNSLRALTHNTDRLRARLSGRPEAEPTSRALERVLHDVLLLVLAPSTDRNATARCALSPFSELAQPDEPAAACTEPGLAAVSIPEDLTPQVTSIVRHGSIVIERHDTVDSVVGEIMTQPVANRLDVAHDAYVRAHEAATSRARLRWLLAFAAAIAVLVLGAAFIIVRLSTSARELEHTTAKLENALSDLKRERDREAELSKLKSQFVSMTSHEFRTPLSVILSSAELVEAYGERWSKHKSDQHLQRIQESALSMSSMLDRVLLIGRAEAGMLELNPAPLRLAELASAVVEEVRAGEGAGRDLRFEVDVASEEVWLDEKLLRHILTNLLSNAFKYSPDGGTVHFTVTNAGDAVVFEVSDEGIGIPEEDQPLLFEAFHRGGNAHDLPGTGLGLAVVKKSVDVHRGTIEVQSVAGRGTTFSVRVPFVKEAA